MSKIQRTVFLITMMASLLFAVSVQAENNTCRIMGSRLHDVWVIVYDADADGNRGPVIWEGKVEAGKKIPITSTDGHIRFDYTEDPNEPYEGDLSRTCFENKIVVVD